MKNRTYILYTGIIAFCFLYAGSAYMSQSYRLFDYYDEITVDLITSVAFYLLHGLGIGVFILGLYRKPEIFSSRKTYMFTLILGTLFMAVSQLSDNGFLIQLFSYSFHFLVGIYFGYYLTFLAQHIPQGSSGLYFGIAYAFASLGTYYLSRIHGGVFLVSKEITAVYLILAAITIAFVYVAEDIDLREKKADRSSFQNLNLPYHLLLVALMTIVFSIGSELYYSLPVANGVNWNLIRAYYAIGLILAGFVIDRNLLIGEICSVASLVYPLISAALIGNGVSSVAALSFSYVIRGFITIYYVIVFTNLSAKSKKLLPLAAMGLMTSRITEAVISLILLTTAIPSTIQLILAAVFTIPLLIVFVLLQNKRNELPLSEEKRLSLYAEKYELTSREAEILKCLKEGLSDTEIAEKLFISRNTVRFHISNLLKKTKSSSRTEIVRSFDQF